MNNANKQKKTSWQNSATIHIPQYIEDNTLATVSSIGWLKMFWSFRPDQNSAAAAERLKILTIFRLTINLAGLKMLPCRQRVSSCSKCGLWECFLVVLLWGHWKLKMSSALLNVSLTVAPNMTFGVVDRHSALRRGLATSVTQRGAFVEVTVVIQNCEIF